MAMIVFLHARLPMTIAPVLWMLIRALNDAGYDDDYGGGESRDDNERHRFPSVLYIAHIGNTVKQPSVLPNFTSASLLQYKAAPQ
jgi:hypothetical protein